MKRLQTATEKFASWIKRDALPLWAKTGFNHTAGISYERLLADGKPDLTVNLRVRVQARQIFSFAMAQYLDWCEDGFSRASQMIEFLETKAKHPVSGNGYVHLMDKDLEVIDLKQDLYDHAFHLLANVWCYRAFAMQDCLQRAVALVTFFDEKFGSEHGGWIEGDYKYSMRRQNPHMHIFEALLAFYDATKDRKWLDRASEIYQLFVERFYDKQNGVLLEFFNDDWTPKQGELGERVEPGHMLEWVWLLRWYESRANVNVSNYADTLYQVALDKGMCCKSGLLYDQISVNGQVLKHSKRCWPVIEYIKASIAQARRGRADATEHAANAIEKLMQFYIEPAAITGAYIDQRGADNGVLVDLTPASTLYHLIVAAAEADDFIRNNNWRN